MANIQGIDKVTDSLGFLVLTDDGAVVSSGGDLQNAEELADKISKLVNTACRISLSSDRRESFNRISVVWDTFMYVITVSNHRIYVCKRQYNSQEPVMA